MSERELIYPDALLDGEFAEYERYPETRIYILEKDRKINIRELDSLSDDELRWGEILDHRKVFEDEDLPEGMVLFESPKDTLSVHDDAGKSPLDNSYLGRVECSKFVNGYRIADGGPVVDWCLCVPGSVRHFGGYNLKLSVIGLFDWTPENEYDLPPSDHVQRCSWSELKAKVDEMNRDLHLEYLSNPDEPLMWAIPALWIDDERGLASCLKADG